MKLLEGLFGFAAFSIGYLLILVWLPVALWIAWRLTKRYTRKGAKLAVGFGAFLILFFLPFADEISGRLYLSHLCATEAGVKVYQTVELPAEYWDGEGRPKFIKGIGALDTDVLIHYDANFEREPYSSMFSIEKFRFWYFEKQNGKILGEIVDFSYMGGWLSRNFSPGPSRGASCDRHELRNSKGVLLSIFRSAATAQH